MSITCTSPEQGPSRANKIFVLTSHSQDGRSLEGFWMDYDPDQRYALFLLEYMLNGADTVNYYMVYDREGKRISQFIKEHFPKRK